MSLLETAWKQREEDVYPAMFGPVAQGIFPLSQDTFAAFGDVNIDPHWLTHGIFEFAPTDTRNSWLYVTSGYSNPWEDVVEPVPPGQYSGAGVEFVLESDRQGDWAIVALQRFLAFELVMATGQFGRGTPLGLNDRIPLGAPIDGTASGTITNVILAASQWPEIHLVSGEAMFVQYVGITDAEHDLAKTEGSPALLNKLAKAGAVPVIAPDRASVI